MSQSQLQEDGLDTCYQITQTTPASRRAWPSAATMMRGGLYSLLTVGALAVGLLAMSPEGLPLDELLGQAMLPKRAGSCCSQLQLEIPGGTAPVTPAPAYQPEQDRPASEEVVSVSTDQAADLQ